MGFVVTNFRYRLHSYVRSYKNWCKLPLLLRLLGKLRILWHLIKQMVSGRMYFGFAF